MTAEKNKDLAYQVGLFRYGIISELLSRPAGPRELAERLREMSKRTYKQPWNQEAATFSLRTLERWLSKARNNKLASEALQPKLRLDLGTTRAINEEHRKWLLEWRRENLSWSVQLLYDNMEAKKLRAPVPSYSTVLRFLKSQGFFPNYRSKFHKTKTREVRSYEVEFVGELWHMDFHKGSRMVITESGEFKQAICAAIVDDKSRLVCHAQWFLNETAEVLVHIMIQAFLKRGIPRSFYSDCGSAMRAEEFTTGLEILDVKQLKTLPYSPYMNGKQEVFWQPLEGRLIQMLPKNKRVTLDVLNAVTQAWVEQDYHVRVHSEINQKPLDRFFKCESVLRPSFDIQELRRVFRLRVTRKQRRTDGSVVIDGVRFDVPAQYRHIEDLKLRYARWDLGEAEILCPHSNKSLCTIFPTNLQHNSIGIRRDLDPTAVAVEAEAPEQPQKNDLDLDLNDANLPPLLARCLREHARDFPTSGYIPLKQKIEIDAKEQS